MTTAQVVETSVTNNSLSKDYLYPDDHTKQIKEYIHLFSGLVYANHIYSGMYMYIYKYIYINIDIDIDIDIDIYIYILLPNTPYYKPNILQKLSTRM